MYFLNIKNQANMADWSDRISNRTLRSTQKPKESLSPESVTTTRLQSMEYGVWSTHPAVARSSYKQPHNPIGGHLSPGNHSLGHFITHTVAAQNSNKSQNTHLTTILKTEKSADKFNRVKGGNG